MNTTTETPTVELEIVPPSMPPVRFTLTDAALTKLKEKHELVEVKSYTELQKGISECVTMRTGVEKHRKELKKGSLEYGKKVDTEAKRIESAIREIEAPMKAAKAVLDAEKEKIRLEKARIEADRVAGHERAITALRNIPLDMVGKTYDEMVSALESLNKTDTGCFAEFSPAATTAKNESRVKLLELIDIEADRVEKEMDRIEQEKIEAEKQRLAAIERKKEADRAAELKAIEDKKLADERAQIAAERKEMADRVAKQEAELKAIRDKEAAQLAAERKKMADQQAAIDQQRADIAAKNKAELEAAEKLKRDELEAARLESIKPELEKEQYTLLSVAQAINEIRKKFQALEMKHVTIAQKNVVELLVKAEKATLTY